VDEAFLKKHQIDFVAHDAAPYAQGDIADVYAFVKERGMFLETKRTEGISTSDIILRLLRGYDTYVERNLDRGYTPEELGLGVVATVRFSVKQSAKEVSGAVNGLWSGKEGRMKCVGRVLKALGGLLWPAKHVPQKWKKGTKIATVAVSAVGLVGALAKVLKKNSLWPFSRK